MKDTNKKCVGFHIVKTILGPIFKIYYRPKFINKEYIPKEGPILLCGNHIHLFDQCLPILSTKRTVHYMAKKEYFDGKWKWFFKLAGCIPVNRQVKDQNAKDAAMEVLRNNGAIGIFPEGTRNRTKELLLPFKFGAVSMAQKTNATIVPFGITGKYKRGKDNKLTVTFARPFKVGDMSLEEANAKLEKEIRNILLKNQKNK